jgi:tyrosyl-tRNA synthetase
MEKVVIPQNISQHSNVFDVLKERGFIKQCTHESEMRNLLANESIRFYIGFDPTADSLHVGHFLQIITMMYMQHFGHVPIALVGGGTTMVGDPSGRTDMRQMMTQDTIAEYGKRFIKTFSRFIDFEDDRAILANNADWLLGLNYLDFIRDIGKHFSVNKMLSYECFKSRMEVGLSFLEFNYMLMQSYDFLELYRRYGCIAQFGGDDHWSNILGGIDLIRREESKQAYGMTFTLLTTSEGKKMGKTQNGALWLDEKKTSPYEFFQYWRNVEDADVKNCLSLLTFLPMDEVNRLSSLEGSAINEAKEILAYEVTALVHGKEVASAALEGARAAFSNGENIENIPSTTLSSSAFEGDGYGLVALLKDIGLVPSNSEGFRTIKQGGLSINGEKITDSGLFITTASFEEDSMLIKKGKKTYHRIVLNKE